MKEGRSTRTCSSSADGCCRRPCKQRYGRDDEDSWKSQFVASGNFENVDTQIAGLGRIEAVEQLYVDHTKAAIDSIGSTDESADSDAAADTEADSAEDSAE